MLAMAKRRMEIHRFLEILQFFPILYLPVLCFLLYRQALLAVRPPSIGTSMHGRLKVTVFEFKAFDTLIFRL